MRIFPSFGRKLDAGSIGTARKWHASAQTGQSLTSTEVNGVAMASNEAPRERCRGPTATDSSSARPMFEETAGSVHGSG
jgi:hypothetical protein